MRLAELSRPRLVDLLRRDRLLLHLSPFVVRISTEIPAVYNSLALMYAEFSIEDANGFADFHIQMEQSTGLRRWVHPQVNFHFDGIPSFHPLPLDHAYPMLEWGLNWCIASHSHQFLILHAAVIEKDGRAVIMPAPPGSGKSTLCAGLVSRGWRLLSDELTLIDMQTGLVQALARPINLKNRSIEVIRDFQPDAVMTEPARDTKKGTVALLRPPADSVRRVNEPACPTWIVFPKYETGSPPTFSTYSKAHTCLRVAKESFNYDIHGRKGFEAVTRLVDGCDCYEFAYGSLEDAVREFSLLPIPS